MRFLLELVVIGALLYLGWATPFREQLPENVARFAGVAPTPAPVRRTVRAVPVASGAASNGSWMWNASNRTALQTPPPAGAMASPAQFPGSWLFDPNHHSPLDPPHKAATPH